MDLIDNYCFKILKKLEVTFESTFTDLSICVINKNTRSKRLKFLINKNLIVKKDGFYKLTEKGKNILTNLKKIEDSLDEDEIYENFDHLPFFYRDYLYNFLIKLKEIFKEDLLSVILFGSVARGKWTKESDIDVLIIFSNKISENMQLDEKLTEVILNFYDKNNLKDEQGNYLYTPIQEISLFHKDLDKFRTLFYDIAMDGLLIFDRNQIGLKFINKTKLRIKKKGLKRIFYSDEDFYWKRNDIKFGEIIEL